MGVGVGISQTYVGNGDATAPSNFGVDVWLRPEDIAEAVGVELSAWPDSGSAGNSFDNYTTTNHFDVATGPDSTKAIVPQGAQASLAPTTGAVSLTHVLGVMVIPKAALALPQSQSYIGNYNTALRLTDSANQLSNDVELETILTTTLTDVASMSDWIVVVGAQYFFDRFSNLGGGIYKYLKWGDGFNTSKNYSNSDTITTQSHVLGVDHANRDLVDEFGEHFFWVGTSTANTDSAIDEGAPSHWPTAGEINTIVGGYIASKYPSITNAGYYQFPSAVALTPADEGTTELHFDSTDAMSNAFSVDPYYHNMHLLTAPSGAAQHLEFNDHANYPTRNITRTLNNYPVLQSNCVDTWDAIRLSGGTGISLTGAFTTVVVWRKPAGFSSTYTNFFSNNDKTGVIGMQSDKVVVNIGTQTTVSTNTVADDAWHIIFVRRDASDNITVYVDSVDDTTGTPNKTGTLAVNKFFRPGANNTTPSTTESDSFAEAVVWSADIGLAGINSFGQALSDKYGLGQTWNLS
jgi:hypothetical protein